MRCLLPEAGIISCKACQAGSLTYYDFRPIVQGAGSKPGLSTMNGDHPFKQVIFTQPLYEIEWLSNGITLTVGASGRTPLHWKWIDLAKYPLDNSRLRYTIISMRQ
jgi:hypothetical protein